MMDTLKRKVAIIGAGNVGSSFAYALMISGLCDEIVIIDINKGLAEGQCMDLNHGLGFASPSDIYAGTYSDCKDANIVVITAGTAQKPGQTRIDMAKTNINIFKKIVPQVTNNVKDATILVVTNPVDILTYVTLKLSGLPKNKVTGSGTLLDSSRFRFLISQHCDIDVRDVHADIIGEHGDTELPVWSGANIGGIHFEQYCPLCDKNCNYQNDLNKIFENVKSAAYKIIDKKGSTYYAIGLALVKIVGAILKDENSILHVSTIINDYYGINDVCLSMPSIVNKNGIDRFIKLNLSDKEQEMLKHSADYLKNTLNKINL